MLLAKSGSRWAYKSKRRTASWSSWIQSCFGRPTKTCRLLTTAFFLSFVFILYMLSNRQADFMSIVMDSERQFSFDGSSLVIAVPFISVNEPPVIWANWQEKLPCIDDQISGLNVAVELVYDKVLTPEEKNACVANIPLEITRCFRGGISVHSTGLSPKQNVYDKARKNSVWSIGPNHVFFHYVMTRYSTYEYMFWMEPDVRILKSNWLVQLIDVIHDLPQNFIVAGSAFVADCLPNETFDKCREISAAIEGHINGNALYHIGSSMFQEMCNDIHGSTTHEEDDESALPLTKWPFDVAMYLWFKDLHQARYLQNLHNFVYHEFIVNYGKYPYLSHELSSKTLFVHGTNADANLGGLDLLVSDSPVRESVVHEPRTHVAAALHPPKKKLDLGPKVQASQDLIKLVKQVSNKYDQVLISFATSNYWIMFENYVYYLEQLGLDKLLILICFEDDKDCALKAARMQNIAFYSYPRTTRTLVGDDAYGGAGFQSVVNTKCRVLEGLMRLPYNILISDIDVIWLKDPTAWFREYEFDYDIMYQSDSRHGTGIAFSNTNFPDFFYNSGIAYFSKHTTLDADLYNLLHVAMTTLPDCQDHTEQWVLNYLFREDLIPDDLRVLQLDVRLFPNGVHFFERTLPAIFDVDPFVIHNNWVNGGIKQKIARFQQLGYWAPHLYDLKPGKKYLTYDDAVKNNGLSNQRAALYSAMAYANFLNRTLILPRFYLHHLLPIQTSVDVIFDITRFQEAMSVLGGFEYHGALQVVAPCTNKVFYVETQPYHRNNRLDMLENNLGIDFDSDKLCTARMENPVTYQRQVIRHPPGKQGWRGLTKDEIIDWLEPYREEQVLVFGGMFRKYCYTDGQDEILGLYNEATVEPVLIQSIANVAISLIQQEPAVIKAGGVWNSVHLRVSEEFLVQHDNDDDTALVRTGEWQNLVDKVAQQLGSNAKKIPLYISGDEFFLNTPEIRATFEREFPRVVTLLDVIDPNYKEEYLLSQDTNMMYGALEQRICAQGKTFVGNIMSSFSQRICRFRLEKRKECVDIMGRNFPEYKDMK